MKNNTKKSGFTIIELLVVVAIIGLLSSIALASLNSARAKGRDAKRLQDLEQLNRALALYASDHNGTYPDSVGAAELISSDPTWINNTNPLGVALVPKYISKLPVDPLNTPVAGQYSPWSGGYTYEYTTYGSDGNATNPAPPPPYTNYDLLGNFETQHPQDCAKKDVRLHSYYSYNPSTHQYSDLYSWCTDFGATIPTLFADH